MHIRSPKTGFINLHVDSRTTTRVASGDLMFSFDADEERLELVKVDASIFLLTQLLARATKIGGAGGSARTFEAARIETSRKTSEAFVLLLKQRAEQVKVGDVTPEVVEQAVLLECLARKEAQETTLDCGNLVSSSDQLIDVTKLQITYNEELRKKLSEDVSRLQILAPATGNVKWLQTRSGWVTRGDILASIES